MQAKLIGASTYFLGVALHGGPQTSASIVSCVGDELPESPGIGRYAGNTSKKINFLFYILFYVILFLIFCL